MKTYRNPLVGLLSITAVLAAMDTAAAQPKGFCYGDEAIIALLGREGTLGGVTKNNRLIITEGPFRGYSSNLQGVVPFRPGTIIAVEDPGGATLANVHFKRGTIVRVTPEGRYEAAPQGTEICVQHDVVLLGLKYSAGTRLVVSGREPQTLLLKR